MKPRNGLSPDDPGAMPPPSIDALQQQLAPSANKAVIFSVLGLLCCGLPAIAGIIFSRRAKEEIKQSGGLYTGSTQATLGLGVGIAAIAIWSFGVLAATLGPRPPEGRQSRAITPTPPATESTTASPTLTLTPSASPSITPSASPSPPQTTTQVGIVVDPGSIPQSTSATEIRATGRIDPGSLLVFSVNGNQTAATIAADGSFAHTMQITTGTNSVVVHGTKAGMLPTVLNYQVQYTPPPSPTSGQSSSSNSSSTYYRNCSEAREAGAAPISRGEPGYRPALDRDGDGIACE